jgi:hypothetical protein
MTRRVQVDRYGGVVKPPEPGSSGTIRAYPAGDDAGFVTGASFPVRRRHHRGVHRAGPT